jgi:hypothetical protein
MCDNGHVVSAQRRLGSRLEFTCGGFGALLDDALFDDIWLVLLLPRCLGSLGICFTTLFSLFWRRNNRGSALSVVPLDTPPLPPPPPPGLWYGWNRWLPVLGPLPPSFWLPCKLTPSTGGGGGGGTD